MQQLANRAGRKRLVLIVLAVVLVLLAGGTTVFFLTRSETKSTDDRRLLARPGEVEADAPDQPVAKPSGLPDSVPAGVVSERCGDGRLEFANPVVRADVCYPNEWKFVDPGNQGPMASIEATDLFYLRLASPTLLPWPPGMSQAQAQAQRGGTVIVVTWDTVRPEVPCRLQSNERIAPAATFVAQPAASPARWCTYDWDLNGQEIVAREDGLFETIHVELPLPHAPVALAAGQPTRGAFLLVEATSLRRDAKESASEVFRFVRSVRLR